MQTNEDMNYRTVFDVSQVGFQWGIYSMLIFMFGTIFILIGWGVTTLDEVDLKWKGRIFQIVGGVAIAFGFLFLIGNYAQYHSAETALATKHYEVAEGTVKNFIPMPPGGHSIESFDIGTKHFQYGAGWGSIAFNSEWNKGFIRNGVQARISYQDEDILKVEVISP
jgi:hypothetical protein